MSTRLAISATTWSAALVAHQIVGADGSGSMIVVGMLVVASTGWIWGATAGLLLGVIAGFGAPASGMLVASTTSGGVMQVLREDTLTLVLLLGMIGFAFGAITNLRRQVRHHEEASNRAQYDALTGLYNRLSFERQLEAWTRIGAEDGSMFAVLFVDLDRFKFVNDTFGHATGDRLLRLVAWALRDNVRDGDVVARLGGDEFVIALRGLRDRSAAAATAEKLVELLATPFTIDGRTVSVSASIGIALYPHDGMDVASLTKSADAAMYVVKARGKNAFSFSSDAMRIRQSRRLDIERALRSALHDGEFELVYQPQVDLADRRLVGFEALLRWRSRDLGLVAPKEFIPIAEDAGMIVPIGHWLLRKACFQVRGWHLLGHTDIKVAVNVSPLQFKQPEFLHQVERAVSDSGIAPGLLELEITESVLIEQFDLALHTLRRLGSLGVRSALDDFGTGYSSLSYLHRLPIGTLKIDQSFVSSLAMSPTGEVGSAVPIIEAMTAMGRNLGKSIVAEGVETEAQARYLMRIGVDRAQGYLFAKPLGVGHVETLLHRVQGGAERATVDLADPVAVRRE